MYILNPKYYVQRLALSFFMGYFVVASKVQIRQIFDMWLASKHLRRGEQLHNIVCFIKDRCGGKIKINEQKIELLLLKFKRLWEKCYRMKTAFERNNGLWLDTDFELEEEAVVASTSTGRPSIPFEASSERTKRRRVEELVSTKSPQEITKAAERCQRREQDDRKTKKSLGVMEALSLFLELDLTKEKYNILRSVANSIHSDFFPSYYALKKAKENLLPQPISITETSAEVPVQSLLNRTTSSLLQMCSFERTEQQKLNLILESKWGFDGSSSHSRYKQKFSEAESTDEFLLVSALVPIRITYAESGQQMWLNTLCSSPKFCRPIKITFIRESALVIRELENEIQNQINNLVPYSCHIKNLDITVSFKLMLTMVDGAVINVLSQNSSGSVCYICGAKPTEMNSLHIRERPVKEDLFKYGLSTLHAHIKFFECLLHIAYRLPLKCWRVSGEQNRATLNQTKKRIQEEFRAELGLLVDTVRPGYGTTNDGNSARRFFANAEVSSKITGIDLNLIKKFGTILSVISCGRLVDQNKFQELLNETVDIYISLYPWYYMPSTVHKVLIHGCQVINNFQIPIGYLSEEPIESKHKELRKVRQFNTRKTSRQASNYDLMANLLLSSEPLLTCNKRSKKLSSKSDIQNYLLPKADVEKIDSNEETSDED